MAINKWQVEDFEKALVKLENSRFMTEEEIEEHKAHLEAERNSPRLWTCRCLGCQLHRERMSDAAYERRLEELEEKKREDEKKSWIRNQLL